jgi:Ni/Fe-hydrogenase subunit HybB-like protein
VLSFRKGPRHSLSVVGRVIGLFVLAAMLSAAGLMLATATLVFTERRFWGWLSVGLIVAYWLALVTSLLISDHFAQRRRQESGPP